MRIAKTIFAIRSRAVPLALVSAAIGAGLIGGYENVTARVMDPDIKKKPSVRDVPFYTVDKGTKSGIKTADRMVIRDEEDWIALWRRHKTDDLAARTMPSVNFDQSMIIAVFQGQESAEAGLIRIDRVKMFSDKVAVFVSENDSASPGPSNPNGARSTTCSYHIVKTARSTLPVVFD